VSATLLAERTVSCYDRTVKTDLLAQAKRLSVSERLELVEAIWDSIAEDAGIEMLPLSEEHRLELDRRLADLEENPTAGSTWDKVRSRLERGR
jgi:putative addiction module component (TIGR02574 family)